MKAWIIRVLKSRTMMFNIFIAVMGVSEAAFGFLQPYIAGNVYGWGMALLTVGNAVLRILTTTSLKDK